MLAHGTRGRMARSQGVNHRTLALHSPVVSFRLLSDA